MGSSPYAAAASSPWGAGAGPAEWQYGFRSDPRVTLLEGGERLALGRVIIEPLHTPGHTPGHCCFHIAAAGVLCSGDQLFAGSIGRTDLPGGDPAALMRSMADRIVPLPGDTVVLPGHGPTTTLARELETNPFLETFRT